MEIHSYKNPLDANHPLVRDGTICPYCQQAFQAEDMVMSISGAPADEEERAKMDHGVPYISIAAVAHQTCGPQD